MQALKANAPLISLILAVMASILAVWSGIGLLVPTRYVLDVPGRLTIEQVTDQQRECVKHGQRAQLVGNVDDRVIKVLCY